eukprot:SAG31_NODE_5491_length_2504_cov_1.442412_3_plen_93_part_00
MTPRKWAGLSKHSTVVATATVWPHLEHRSQKQRFRSYRWILWAMAYYAGTGTKARRLNLMWQRGAGKQTKVSSPNDFSAPKLRDGCLSCALT